MVTYRFPRQTTVFGPQQVEARIDQDPVISSQFTLLNQAGSRVIRGNLLVIPVDETVMYVQPVYLQATGVGGAPTELQFVVVVTNLHVAMEPTLEQALAAIANASASTETSSAPENVEAGGAPAPAATEHSALDALDAYQRGQRALQEGDWEAYGEAQAELESILEQLALPASGTPIALPSAAPVATPITGA
jgi:uncharacterized membrane protein (UPF0182 family)